MKFPVLWLSFVSLWAWAGAEKGILPRMGLSVPFAYHPCTSVQNLEKKNNHPCTANELMVDDIPWW